MAANRSANIGVSLTTPAHAPQGLAGSIEKDAVRRCCALWGLAARAMRQAPAGVRPGGSADIGPGGGREHCELRG